MISEYSIYGLGIVVSVFNVLVWRTIISSQIKQLKVKQSYLKKLLLIFATACLLSNFVPIWFDVYQIVHHAHVKNIVYAYSISQYMFRTIVTFMFYLIFRI